MLGGEGLSGMPLVRILSRWSPGPHEEVRAQCVEPITETAIEKRLDSLLRVGRYIQYQPTVIGVGYMCSVSGGRELVP